MSLPKLLCIIDDKARANVIAEKPSLEHVISNSLIADQTMLIIEEVSAPWIDQHGIMHLDQRNLEEVMAYIGDTIGDITMGVSIDKAMDNLITMLTGQPVNIGG